MDGRKLMTLGLTSIGFLAMSMTASANWSDSVFPIKSHDFGTVAVASKTEFRFPVVNNLPQQQTLHIRNVRASCGCTTPIIEDHYIAPGQTGAILARFNTPTFRGKKGATLTVVIDQPFYTEVRLRVDGYIRSDMVFHPGEIELGTIQQGETKTGATKILYAGRSDWQVLNVRSTQPWLVPTFEQTSRGNGQANYELTVEVQGNAPVGFFQKEVIVQTNDRSMPNVPLRVTGSVETALTLAPQSIALGTVPANQTFTQRLIVRGREAFAIDSITCDGWDVSFEASDVAKKIHMLNLTLRPTAKAIGNQRVPVVITTRGPESVSAKAILTANVQAAPIDSTALASE
ncbi:MAG: DUF1573 domain-containing protein [Planctomycetota bacterium]